MFRARPARCCSSHPPGAGKLPLERLFAAPDLSGPALRGVKISPDGRLVAYLQGARRRQGSLRPVGIRRHGAASTACWSTRARSPARTRRLSAEEEARRERQRTSALSGIVEYSFAPDSRHLLIPLNGDLYVYDLARKPADGGAARSRTPTPTKPTRASRRARHFVSFMRDQNLFVIDLANGTERAVTREGGGLVSFGVAEFIAQEEMDRDTGYWWSPDERRIALDARRRIARGRSRALRDPGHGRARRAPALSRHRHRAMRASTCSSRTSAAESRLQLDLGAEPTSIYRASNGSRTAAASPCSARAATRRRWSCCDSTR